MAMNKQQLYWLCQIIGWSFYGVLSSFLYYLDTENVSADLFINQIIPIAFHILLTHLIRHIIIHRGWLTLNLSKVIPRILVTTIIFSLVNYGLVIVYTLLIGELSQRDFQLLVASALGTGKE